MTLEDEDPEPYCSPANEAPETPFNPWRNIRPSSWVLLRPKDPLIHFVWQRRVVSTVCKDQRDVDLENFYFNSGNPKVWRETLH